MSEPEPPPVPDWIEALLPTSQQTQPEGSPRPGLPRADQVPEASGSDGPAVIGMTPVKSSNIAAAGHDGESLWIKFLNGTLYRYPTAGADLHKGLLAAESAGQYFHQRIKSIHKGERIS